MRGIAESVRLDIEKVYAQNVLRAVTTIRSKRRKEGSVILRHAEQVTHSKSISHIGASTARGKRTAN